MKNLLAISIVWIALTAGYSQRNMMDLSFGSGGTAVDIDKEDSEWASAVKVQVDGKIIVTGQQNFENRRGDNFTVVRLVRFDIDGSRNMRSNISHGADYRSVGKKMDIQKDGKIVIAGVKSYEDSRENYQKDIFIERVDRFGREDQTFNYSAMRFGSIDQTRHNEPIGIKVLSDRRIVLAGKSRIDNGNQRLVMLRLKPDGSLDTSFGEGGSFIMEFEGEEVEFNKMQVQEDGKILLVGSANRDLDNDILVLRLNENGQLDPTFGNNGRVRLDFGTTADFGVDILEQRDGKLIIIGTVFNGATDDLAAVRIFSNGTIDESFGIRGKVLVDFNREEEKAVAGALLPDGRIVIAAEKGNYFGVACLLTSGDLDQTFGDEGRFVSDAHPIRDMAVTPDNKIVIVGQRYVNSDRRYDLMVSRLVMDLSVTTTFDALDEESSTVIYPNPIYSEATFSYDLLEETHLSLQLFDQTGRLVRSFFRNQEKGKGNQKELLDFNGLNAGIYHLVLQNPNGKKTIKVVKH